MAKKTKIASVLAFEKKLIPSDGAMSGTRWDDRYNTSTPLKLQEKSIKGTISNRLKAEISNDPIKLNAKIENSNLQRVDNCALDETQDTLKFTYTLKILSGVQNPSACNDLEYNETLTKAIEEYIEKTDCIDIARRYALNIANGRFLWRNRVGAEKIEVIVKILNEGKEKEWKFNAHEFNLRNFYYNNNNITELSNEISGTLSGENDFLLLDITAYAKVGKAQDVYPSEELILDKSSKKNSTGKKSKILYERNGNAAMHSQKIGNALRTIDTWYPNYESQNMGPIAAETYGAVTNSGKAFRNPTDKADFFTLFDRFSTGIKLDNIEEEHYVMAVLVRGGVFGESDKE